MCIVGYGNSFINYSFIFYSIDKIHRIQSQTLIIHGTEDEVIDFSHGVTLYQRCQNPVEPLWVEGAGHNDVELYGQYLERIRKFINQVLFIYQIFSHRTYVKVGRVCLLVFNELLIMS